MVADAPIEVLRDGYGVPHCYAASETDAFYAQGWVHADDRLWQMEYDRRRARGRWAEVAGRRGVASDSFCRRVDLSAAVARDLPALLPRTRAMLESYAAGVNARIAAGDLGREFAIAGIEPAPWQPEDSLLVYRVRHIMMGSARHKLWRSVVRRVLGEAAARSMVSSDPDGALACVPPGEHVRDGTGTGDGAGGSNNWVLSGTRTAHGLPLLAGDPHREVEAPNVYVQGHLACPDWSVLGIGMAGVPGFPHFGHNTTVAWSITHAMADDQDLFEVDVDEHPTRTEIIEVRDDEPVEVAVVSTPWGPVIGDGLAMSWTATADVNRGFDAIASMLSAATVDELFAAMRPWVEPANNLLAADVEGHIGYLTRGRMPRRSHPDAAIFPVPRAEAAAARWSDWVPFDELPRLVDPPDGFLYSANNLIAVSPPAPYIGIDVAPSWRARRIVDALRTSEHATVTDMETIHRDVVSLAARRVAARVDWAPLRDWDGRMDSDSTAAAAYSVLRGALFDVVLDHTGLAGVTGDARNRLLPGIRPEGDLWRVVERHLAANDETLVAGLGWDGALAAAVARAESTWQGETWGELHKSAPVHALADPSLNPPARPIDGDLDTVKVSGYIPSQPGFRARTGSVARYAFDLADWDRSGWVVPHGSAGDVTAEHGFDQGGAWAEGRLVPALYTLTEVEAAATRRTMLPRP